MEPVMWTYNQVIINSSDELPIDTMGFVYEITNLVNGRRYIGKKLLNFTKTKILKGKKKRVKTESDWQNYYGSNDELLEDVKKYGKESFRRRILRCCCSKGEMSYFEAKFQFENDCLESDMWYNSWISCKIHKKHLTYLRKDVK